MNYFKKIPVSSVLLAIVLLPALIIRLRLLSFPLERDEGEYAYAGQMLLQGVMPYDQVYNMKWPGVYAAYAFIMSIFGQTPAGIHLGITLVSLFTALLLFIIVRRMAGRSAGIVAAGTYSLLSISTGTLGLMGHATHFIMLPVMGALALLMKDQGSSHSPAWKIFVAGLLLGIAALMKQHGAIFSIFCLVWLISREYGRMANAALVRDAGWLAFGGVLPLLLTGILMAAAGVFGKFWLWTFTYARYYASLVSITEGVSLFYLAAERLIASSIGLWCLVFLGAVLLFRTPSLRPWRRFVIGFSAASFLAVCPSLYFRAHYFIVMLPAVGMVAGMTAAGISELKLTAVRPAFITGLLFTAAAALSLWTEREVFFTMSPERACRTVYGANPFPESLDIASYIEKHCPLDEKIVVLGSEPQIYFYSHRHSATGYIYMYPLMEHQPLAVTMQKEMIREVEAAKPRYTIFVSVSTSWDRSTDSEQLLLHWMEPYISKQKTCWVC